MRLVVATVVLVTFEARALVLRRRPDDRSFAHAWCLPGGGIEDGETVEAAALRETLEESGLVVELRRSLGLRESELIRRDRHLEDLRFDIHRFVATSRTDRIQLSDEHVAFRWLTREAASSAAAILPGGLAGDITGELLRRFAEGELEPDERVS